KVQSLEQTQRALQAELEASNSRAAEMAAALDEGRATAAGEVGRLQSELSQFDKRVAQLVAERDDLSERMGGELRSQEEAKVKIEQLEAEVQRLAGMEAQVAEAPRLRRELAHAHEILQQRTQQAEASARAAHQANA